MSAIAVLLTDFGLVDGYVGMMKGLMLQICSHLHIVDLSHQIPSQDICSGRFCLLSAVDYFPKGSIFVAVVDPGVGSQRRGIGIAWQSYKVIAPDNGLISGLLDRNDVDLAVELTNADYWRIPVPSTTFHGRDIFAPVAAHLAAGVPLEILGDRLDPQSLVRLPLPSVEIITGGLRATVQYIDHFGNIVTNIPVSQVAGKNWSIQRDRQTIPSVNTYSDRSRGELMALIGSHDWVEIAMNEGNAAEQLGIKVGDRVNLLWI
jgi:S-adenosylmethionine hydrolase